MSLKYCGEPVKMVLYKKKIELDFQSTSYILPEEWVKLAVKVSCCTDLKELSLVFDSKPLPIELY